MIVLDIPMSLPVYSERIHVRKRHLAESPCANLWLLYLLPVAAIRVSCRLFYAIDFVDKPITSFHQSCSKAKQTQQHAHQGCRWDVGA
jgi:hypothetical protein